jgi:hypothetical protein
VLTIAPILQHRDMFTADDQDKVNQTISWLEGGDAKDSETPNHCTETYKYFENLSLCEEFEARQADMTKRVRQQRIEWVREKLRQWDEEKAVELERCVWGWHPLFHLCTSNRFLSRRMPPLPWTHTMEEAKTVMAALSIRTPVREAPNEARLLRLYSIMLKMDYGYFDPCTGANRETLERWAKDTARLENASAMLVGVGGVIFGLPPESRWRSFSPEATIAALNAVRDGNWGELLTWTESTQARGVEDYAFSHPRSFEGLWCSRSKEDVWVRGPANQVRDCLARREDLDLRFLPLHFSKFYSYLYWFTLMQVDNIYAISVS